MNEENINSQENITLIEYLSDDINGDWEDNSAVVLSCDAAQCLEISQLPYESCCVTFILQKLQQKSLQNFIE